MKIHGDVISPFVRMCLVTAHEAGLAERVSLVPTNAKMTEVNAELQKLSPVGKIPVLVTDHDHVIHDSRVIMEYVAHVAGRSDLIPDDGVKRFSILTLQATAIGAAEAAVSLRYEQALRPEAMRWPDYMARLKVRIHATLDEAEKNWTKALEPVSVASISFACLLGYVDFRHDALNWRDGRPRLANFAAAFADRPSMKAWPLS